MRFTTHNEDAAIRWIERAEALLREIQNSTPRRIEQMKPQISAMVHLLADAQTNLKQIRDN